MRTALEALHVALHVWRGLARNGICPPQYYGARPTPRRLLNLYWLTWEWFQVVPLPRSYPVRLCIEATSACNLACPHCFTGAGEVGRPRATLSLDFYRGLLDELAPWLWQIEFHNWGEPLLNKQLPTMIAEATERGLSTAFCTNFSVPFDAARAEALVASGLKLLGVSIDGARQETYEQYRVNGTLALVLENCRLVAEAKRRLGSATPRMVWGFHAFAHNVDDVDDARAAAAALDMDFHVSRGRVVGPDWDPGERWMPHDRIAPVPCFGLWHTAVVYADGSMAPCRGSFYPEDDVGQLAADGRPGAATFREAWHGERYRLARRLFRSREGVSPSAQRLVCFECPYLIDWHHYAGHMAAGGRRDDWRPRYDSNERFNYFWNRRPRAAAAQARRGRA
ncbi:MAG TPA: radical SAM protein [Candidatus Binatia bacterium]|nr:radical SAM protein [Candidatus Binatia bacterium]